MTGLKRARTEAWLDRLTVDRLEDLKIGYKPGPRNPVRMVQIAKPRIVRGHPSSPYAHVIVGAWELAKGKWYQRVILLRINDKKGRLMVIVCHNTDLGDGWEREDWNEDYFREISAKKAYPMGINIVVYAMTH